MSQQDSNNNSIIKSFSSQASSKGFSDELFTPNFDSLFSSKKEIIINKKYIKIKFEFNYYIV